MTLQTTFAPARGATRRARRGSGGRDRFGTVLRQMIGALKGWHERMWTRRQLRNLCALDDHILQDIGLTRATLRSGLSRRGYE